MHPDLSVDGEPPFSLQKWNCGQQECEHCGVETALPFDCPVINCDFPVKVWLWNKATGDNERTTKAIKTMKFIFEELRSLLIAFAKHSIPLQLFNRMRYMNLLHLTPNRGQICSDFSSQVDLEPIRKMTCHVNDHASLGIFCIFLIQSITVDGEDIQYTACHEWFILGGSKEKGKQNDWIFHNAALDYIIEFYGNHYSNIKIWDMWTDNCPGQYKCRQNFFQCAKKTVRHNHLEQYNHNFAKQHGFKNNSDTISRWMKDGVKRKETEFDIFASDPFKYFSLAKNYIKSNPAKYETLINNKGPDIKKSLISKSPYEATKRFVAFIDDDRLSVEKLKSQYPDDHFIYSDRSRMEAGEDIKPIEHTTQFYLFTHNSLDDNTCPDDYDDIPMDGTKHVCKFCFDEYKNSHAFENHQKFCMKAIECQKGHRIRFKHFKCYCKQCIRGHEIDCIYQESSGKEHSKWLVSLTDSEEIEANILLEKRRTPMENKKRTVDKAIMLFGTKYHHAPYPDATETYCRMTKNHWIALAEACGVAVQRSDGAAAAAPRVIDVQIALNEFGGWQKVLDHVRT
mmetsp:Transcript_12327/g.23097  ORF Transcript_12327/g.23097 Transcript_12327/m.23097 type:complete len:567 (-) Transcript_12327:550-2250(-)